MKKIRLAFIGAGFNGQIGHLNSFKKIKNCEFTALAEYRDKLRFLIKKKYRFLRVYKSHEELLTNEKNIDGIIIVTKRTMTAPIAFEVVKKKINVFTEKPMASTFLQSKKISNLAKKNKIIYKIGFNKIFDPVIFKAKKIFDSMQITKDLGKLVMIKSHRLSGSGYPDKPNYIETFEKNVKSDPSWPGSPTWLKKKFKKDYEKYLNLYSHNINMLRFFLGNNLNIKFSDLDDKYISTVILKYRKKIPVLLTTAFFTKNGWDDYLQFFYEKGYMKISFPPQHIPGKFTICEIERSAVGKKNIIFKNNKTWSFDLQAKDFIKNIRQKKIKYNNAQDVTNDMLMIENIWKKYINKSNSK